MIKKKLAIASLAVPLCFAAAAYAKAFVPTYHTVQAKELKGETHFLKTGIVGKALQSFRLGFTGPSDYEINALGFLPSTDRIFTALADQGGDDKYDFDAVYVSTPEGSKSRKATGDCDGTHQVCKLPITLPQDELGHVFVLQGFNFKRKETNDANVRRVMVRGNLVAKRVEVLFIDNGNTPYSADVRFATVPRSHFRDVKTVSGSRKEGGWQLFLKRDFPAAMTVISGFDVGFENGDHHLQAFSIGQNAKDFVVTLRDQNGDDPYHATIDYAAYKE